MTIATEKENLCRQIVLELFFMNSFLKVMTHLKLKKLCLNEMLDLFFKINPTFDIKSLVFVQQLIVFNLIVSQVSFELSVLFDKLLCRIVLQHVLIAGQMNCIVFLVKQRF